MEVYQTTLRYSCFFSPMVRVSNEYLVIFEMFEVQLQGFD